MSIFELSRSEGLQYAKKDPVFQQDNVDCLINQKRSYSAGTLYLTEEYVIFVPSEESDYSLVIEYPRIGIHAVSHENTLWKRPCIYCQISGDDEEEAMGFEMGFGDTSVDLMDMEGEEGEEEVEEEVDDSQIFEVLFSPADQNAIDPIFENLSRLQLAHPDPVKEEEDDGMFMTADGLMRVEDHVCNLFEKAAVGVDTSVHM